MSQVMLTAETLGVGEMAADIGHSQLAIRSCEEPTIIGDRRMNVAAAVTHLLAPQITPSVLAEDAALVRDWVADSRLTQYVDGAVPWLAAYWTFASDDTGLMVWCESVLR